jgi:hypothetical protein
MKNIGIVLSVIGVTLALFFLFVFDPSVSTGFGRVNNIGKLSFQQNMLIFGCALAVVGAVLAVFAITRTAKTGSNLSGRKSALNLADDRALDAIKRDDDSALLSLLGSGVTAIVDELPSGRGILQYAIVCNSTKCVKVLIDAGARATVPDSSGETPLAVSSIRPNPDIRALLNGGGSRTISASSSTVSSAEVSGRRTAGPERSITSDLAELARLRDAGHLTEDEFVAAKARLFG